MGVRATATLLAAAVALAAGCGSGERPSGRPEAGWTTYRDAAFAYTVTFPSAWHRADRSLTPNLTDPHEILTLATYELRHRRGIRCGHVAEQAVRDLGDRDVLFTIQERRGPSGFPPRPASADLGPPAETDASECAGRRGEIEEHWLRFRDRGRGFHVYVAFGRHAPSGLRADAVEVLDSIRFRAPAERRGARLLLPGGWHLNAGPLTLMRGELLAAASYRIPDRPPDRNCSPKAATDALPADGALMYLFEYPSLNARQLRRFPAARPRPRLTERAMRAYECMGTSELLHWRERRRGFQAHLFLGPEATPERRRELRAAFDSLVVHRE